MNWYGLYWGIIRKYLKTKWALNKMLRKYNILFMKHHYLTEEYKVLKEKHSYVMANYAELVEMLMKFNPESGLLPPTLHTEFHRQRAMYERMVPIHVLETPMESSMEFHYVTMEVLHWSLHESNTPFHKAMHCLVKTDRGEVGYMFTPKVLNLRGGFRKDVSRGIVEHTLNQMLHKLFKDHYKDKP